MAHASRSSAATTAAAVPDMLANCVKVGQVTSPINVQDCCDVMSVTYSVPLVDIDECLTATCANGAQCVDGVNGYTCDCTNGYLGEFCEGMYQILSSAPNIFFWSLLIT